MKKLIFIFQLISIIYNNAFSQAVTIDWSRCYGGIDHDRTYFIDKTSDNGYIIAGSSESFKAGLLNNHGRKDIWVIQINEVGDTLWTKCLGGANNEIAYSIRESSDSGFIIAGQAYSNDGDVSGNHGRDDYWIVKLNSSGDTLWTKCLGGSSIDIAYSIRETSDSSFIVAGMTFSDDGDVSGYNGNLDTWLVKLDSSGDTLWTKCFGGSSNDKAYWISETSDSNYIFAGQTLSKDGDVHGNNGGNDYWIVKLNSSGDTLWTKCLGGPYGDIAYYIDVTSENGLIIAGYGGSEGGYISGNHGKWDYWIVKLNSTGDTLWAKCFGGSNDDVAYSIHETSDTGFIVAGKTRSNDGDVSGNHGGYDYWIVKLSSSGDTLWTKCFGGSNDDVAYSIREVQDSGFIVAGYTESFDGDISVNHGVRDYWIVRLDKSGTLLWEKSYGEALSDLAYDILQINNKFLIVGYSLKDGGDVHDNQGEEDLWIIKLNSYGDTLWTKCLGGSEPDEANAIQETSDGGYVIAGYTESNDGDVSGNHGKKDYWIIKLNSFGDTLWTKCMGGSDDDVAHTIKETSDNGIFVAGYTSSTNGDVSGFHGAGDFWIVKLNSSGDTLWTKCLGGSSGEKAYSIQETSDSCLIVAGYTSSNPVEGVPCNYSWGNYWIVKLNLSGDILWSNCLGGSEHDVAYSIQETSDNNFIVAGRTESNDGAVSGNHGKKDYWIVKLNSSGDTLWTKCLGGSDDDLAYSVSETLDKGIIVAGITYSNDGNVSGNHGQRDYWIVKLNSYGDILWSKCLGGWSIDEAYSIRETSDNDIIVAGTTMSVEGDVSGNHDGIDSWVVKFSVSGEYVKVDTSICEGESYYVGGAYQTTSGTYYDTLSTIQGNDSLIITKLTVNSDEYITIDTSICEGESYFAGGAYQTTSGIYHDTLQTIQGCDSIILTNLTVIDCINYNKLVVDKNIQLYPVPTKGKLYIEIPDLERIELYNNSGLPIYKTKKNTIDFSIYEPGIYIVKIIDTTGNYFIRKVTYIK